MVKIAAVLDTTILIGLQRIGRLDLLPALIEPAWTTPAVIEEFGETLEWMSEQAPANVDLERSLRMSLDVGEASAIALAVEKQCRVVLDDRKARLVAHEMGLACIGTVALLIKSKEAGLLETVGPVFDELEEVGFHLGRALREEALRISGESSETVEKP